MTFKKFMAMVAALMFAVVTLVQAETAATMLQYTIKDASGKVLGSFTAPANATAAQLTSALNGALPSSYGVSSAAAQGFGHTASFMSQGMNAGATIISTGGATTVATGAATSTAAVGTAISTTTIAATAGALVVVAAAAGGSSSSTPATTGTTGTTGTR